MMGIFNPFSVDSWSDLGDRLGTLGGELRDYGASWIGMGKDEDGDWEWNLIKHNPISGTADYVGDWMGWLGITDTDAADRAQEAAEAGQAAANAALDTQLQPTFDALGQAAAGRDLGTNLDRYGNQMSGAMGGTLAAGQLANEQANASNPMNVGNYFKDRKNFVANGTNKALAGSAGGAMNPNIGTQQLNQQSGAMWDKAFESAMGDASNNLGVARNYGTAMGQGANLAGQHLNAANQPALDYLQLNNDRAMQRYAANIGLTQSAAQAAGQSRAII